MADDKPAEPNKGARNTCVANLQGTAAGDVCAASSSGLTGSGGDGSLPREITSVLNFETGQIWEIIDLVDRFGCRRSAAGSFSVVESTVGQSLERASLTPII